ncbi:uncharacterized protein LOC118347932 [Juglans regia]|uniref:Uncharacterized protein LOC118347932 n=1 Tax=Juglans regia TaxID=51240 RepID=A0A6P9ENM4_JUGRE|nr:uncharacterized protein LOC118347932 [Juglans regia]
MAFSVLRSNFSISETSLRGHFGLRRLTVDIPLQLTKSALTTIQILARRFHLHKLPSAPAIATQKMHGSHAVRPIPGMQNKVEMKFFTLRGDSNDGLESSFGRHGMVKQMANKPDMAST